MPSKSKKSTKPTAIPDKSKSKKDTKVSKATLKVVEKVVNDTRKAEPEITEGKYLHRSPYTSFNIKKVFIEECGEGFIPKNSSTRVWAPKFMYRFPSYDDEGKLEVDDKGETIEVSKVLKFEGPRAKGEHLKFTYGVTEQMEKLTEDQVKRQAAGKRVERVRTGKYKCSGGVEFTAESHKALRAIMLQLSSEALYYLWANSSVNGGSIKSDKEYDYPKELDIHNFPTANMRNPLWYATEKKDKKIVDARTGAVTMKLIATITETAPASMSLNVNISKTGARTDFRTFIKEKKINDQGTPIVVIKRKIVRNNNELFRGFTAIPTFEVKMMINNSSNKINLVCNSMIITKLLASRQNDQGLTIQELEDEMKAGETGLVYTRDELIKEHPEMEDDLKSDTEDSSSSSSSDNKKKKSKKDSSSEGDDAASDGDDTSKKTTKRKQASKSSESSSSDSTTESEEISEPAPKKSKKKDVEPPKPTKKVETKKVETRKVDVRKKINNSASQSKEDATENSMQDTEASETEASKSEMDASQSESEPPAAKASKTIKISRRPKK